MSPPERATAPGDTGGGERDQQAKRIGAQDSTHATMSADPTNLDHALHYAARGWPVFPLVVSSKRPATKRGFHDATTDLDQVRKWWTEAPNAGIGIATGIAFDVLDIDHSDYVIGVADLPDCETDGGPIVRTGSGKWHLYLRPTGLGRMIRVSRHCDWLGTGGYVIAPPSIHPDTSAAYTWYASDHLPLTDAPAPLVDFLKRSRETPRAAISQPFTTARPTGGGYSAAGLVGQVATAPEGTRNETLHWAACRLGEDLRSGKVSNTDARSVADRLVRVAVMVGLDEREATGTVRSGFGKGKAA